MTADLSSQSDLITQLRNHVQAMTERAGQELDSLKAEREQLVKERDGLKAELGKVMQERDGLKAERDQVLKALLHVFPYEFYAVARPDLSEMTNEQRALHFVQYGIHEGVSLESVTLLQDLRAERDQVVKERDGLKAEHDHAMKAILHVFPYEFYAKARPDISQMTNEEMAAHFIKYGIHEGVSLEYLKLRESLESSHREECMTLVARLNELESLVSQYSARLSVVQDLFVKLSIEKRGS